MKVLIILEDPTLDQYVVRPIVEQIFADLSRRARVSVLKDPHLRGAQQALDPEIVRGIIRDNPMEDLFILVVDRDCNRFGNQEKATSCEAEQSGRLLACVAVEEIEVWTPAIHRKSLATSWAIVRAECDPKEAFWDPLAVARGFRRPGVIADGRKAAMRNIGQEWRGVLEVCPEIAHLKERIRVWIDARKQ